jgi:hypothetical protein
MATSRQTPHGGGRAAGVRLTLRWRKVDSNLWSPRRERPPPALTSARSMTGTRMGCPVPCSDPVSLPIEAFGDLVTPAARHQHRRSVLKQVAEIGARGSAQFEDVAEPACRHKCDSGALLLEQRVGDDGCCVGEERSAAGSMLYRASP